MQDVYIIEQSHPLGAPGGALTNQLAEQLDQSTLTLNELRRAYADLSPVGLALAEDEQAGIVVRKLEVYCSENGIGPDTRLVIDHQVNDGPDVLLVVLETLEYCGRPGDAMYDALGCEDVGYTISLSRVREAYGRVVAAEGLDLSMAEAFVNRVSAYCAANAIGEEETLSVSVYHGE